MFNSSRLRRQLSELNLLLMGRPLSSRCSVIYSIRRKYSQQWPLVFDCASGAFEEGQKVFPGPGVLVAEIILWIPDTATKFHVFTGKQRITLFLAFLFSLPFRSP
jgi:hypothetical protein